MRKISNMRNFKPIPNPPTTPRIQSRKDIEKIERDYRCFMVIFWTFFNELGEWREGVDKRLMSIERKLPISK